MRKPTTPQERRDKATATSEAAKSIVTSESAVRDAKSAKLKKARLERDAEKLTEASAEDQSSDTGKDREDKAPRT